MADENIIPFGKYKGQEIDQVAARDPQYLQWLTQQAWFVEKYQHLTVNINNFGAAPEETPAHNAMQVRFLDSRYREAIVIAAAPLTELAWQHGIWEGWSPLTVTASDFALQTHEIMASVGRPEFEDGVDVKFHVSLKSKNQLPRYTGASFKCLVEIKPTMGDDFPAVLRQVKRQIAGASEDCCWILLVGEFTGTGATLDQVRQVFAPDKITLVLAAEVEAELTKIQQGEKSP